MSKIEDCLLVMTVHKFVSIAVHLPQFIVGLETMSEVKWSLLVASWHIPPLVSSFVTSSNDQKIIK